MSLSILITGTSSGIGYETALGFARAGHQVYATMRNPAKAPELAAIAAAESLPILVSALDVDSDASVAAAFHGLQEAGARIDVLINNAGVERIGAVEELAIGEFRAAMETNYFGALRCIQAVIPQMRGRRSGCIVNVTSVSGRISSAPFAAYAASKWALEALSEALAQEMKAFNVRVAIVEPGIIGTPMARRIEDLPPGAHYPHSRRIAARFREALKAATPPSAVAGKILEIVDSGTWQLRHVVGGNAATLIEWRKGVTDEEWVAFGAVDDETYLRSMSRAAT